VRVVPPVVVGAGLVQRDGGRELGLLRVSEQVVEVEVQFVVDWVGQTCDWVVGC